MANNSTRDILQRMSDHLEDLEGLDYLTGKDVNTLTLSRSGSLLSYDAVLWTYIRSVG